MIYRYLDSLILFYCLFLAKGAARQLKEFIKEDFKTKRYGRLLFSVLGFLFGLGTSVFCLLYFIAALLLIMIGR